MHNGIGKVLVLLTHPIKYLNELFQNLINPFQTTLFF